MKLKIGEKTSLDLPSNATAGYKWCLRTSVDQSVLKVSSIYNAPKKAKLGAGGSETWTFEGVSHGKIQFVLEYTRSNSQKVEKTELCIFEVVD